MLQFSMVTDELPPTFKYSFDWLRWVLAVAWRAFSCSMCNLLSWPRIEHGPLCWELRVLASGSAENTAISYLKKKKKSYLFIFGCAGSSLLCGLFSGCRAWGLLSCFCAAYPCGGCSVWEPETLGSRAAVVVNGLSCSMARGIFPDQGLNPCLLHWQVDS